MKKISAIFLVAVFLALPAVYAGGPNVKKERADFYLSIQNKLGFSKKDCLVVQKTGYTPYYCFVLLSLAKESGKPIADFIKMRSAWGYSWKDMCDETGINYNNFMDRLEKTTQEKNIVFPVATSAEQKKTVTTVPRKKGGKVQ